MVSPVRFKAGGFNSRYSASSAAGQRFWLPLGYPSPGITPFPRDWRMPALRGLWRQWSWPRSASSAGTRGRGSTARNSTMDFHSALARIATGIASACAVYTACVHIRRPNIPSGLTATTRLMRSLLAVALTLAVCPTQPAQAEPPKPQPHPSAKGKRITWVSYVWEREGPNWTFRCYVPTSGKQQCQLIVLG